MSVSVIVSLVTVSMCVASSLSYNESESGIEFEFQ